MQEVLKQLRIDEENKGASTGTKWIGGKGKSITSFSPVDGKKIAAVAECDEEAYEQVIGAAQKAFEDQLKKYNELKKQADELASNPQFSDQIANAKEMIDKGDLEAAEAKAQRANSLVLLG